LHKLQLMSKVKDIFGKLMEGVMSVKKVKNVPLFIFLTFGIWASYFLHFYFTFFCFEYTSGLGMMAALVIFVVGSIAVVVPTPNGAGPWHFAVKTMLMLYGVEAAKGAMFALIVHTIQTLLVIALGIYGMLALNLTNKQKS
ncbi:MAG: flippase-like domain-containing protein, partial [Bacteroidaceae bacterium]|nr:flippase-like domain-containing protein [Bacteroidaceae bacterium]